MGEVPSHDMGEQVEEIEATQDLSQTFREAVEQGNSEAWQAFDERLNELRREPRLTIAIDWSVLHANPERTQNLMRKMKALKEYSRGQQRELIIRGTRSERLEAAKIEPNVLSSGIQWGSTDANDVTQ